MLVKIAARYRNNSPFRPGESLCAIVEAESHDDAIAKYKNTFVGTHYLGTIATQSVSEYDPTVTHWRVHFLGGWSTHYGTLADTAERAVKAFPDAKLSGVWESPYSDELLFGRILM